MSPSVQCLGDAAVLVKWPEATTDEVPQHVIQLTKFLNHRSDTARFSLVPGFASLTIHYSPLEHSFADIRAIVLNASLSDAQKNSAPGRLFEIPVCYELEFGPDLHDVAALHDLSVEEVIHKHASAEYQVRMIGFSPGFPYLSGLPKELATPRRWTPRLQVSAGSVAIGGSQAGIYSMESPGGWNIIGRSPQALFQPHHDPPALLTAGDRLRFFSITADELRSWTPSS